MADPKPLAPGDSCPNCGGHLDAARVPSTEQRASFDDKELRTPYPPDMDSVSETQRATLGALHRCGGCGYVTRFPLKAAAAAPSPRHP